MTFLLKFYFDYGRTFSLDFYIIESKQSHNIMHIETITRI